jgi:excisionase family DNA binding protein
VTAIDTRNPTNTGGSDRAVPHDLDPQNSLPEPVTLEPTKPASSPTGSPRDTGARQRPGSCRPRSRRAGRPGMPQEGSIRSLGLSDLPPTISVEETAVLLGISRSAAYRAAKAGQLVAFRVGRRLLVPTAPLLRMLGQ